MMNDSEQEMHEASLKHSLNLAEVGIWIEIKQSDEWWTIEANFGSCPQWQGCLTWSRNYLTLAQACGIIEGIAVSLGLA